MGGPRILLNLSLVCLLLWSFCFFSSAQTAQLSGVITDQSHAALADANVTAINQSTRIERTTRSNRAGYYTFTFLPPGIYCVSAQSPGFKTAQRTKIELGVAALSRLDFLLEVAGSKEIVTVRAEAFGVQSESPSVGTSIDHQLVANLPLNGRTIQGLITLAPGVVSTFGDGQFSVNGQRDDANYLTVDGVSANLGLSAFRALQETAAGTVPAFNVVGTSSNLVSIDAMQEFRLQTSTYSAEFGRTPGAQIQIMTRSGTAQFHGGLFDYFRNDALDANDWFAHAQGLPKAPLRQNDFGGVFGGPLIQDKTFFFTSYEGLRLRQPQFARINVPSLAARSQAPSPIAQLLNAFPLPNGPDDPVSMVSQFSAAYSNPTSSDSASLRIDHAITSKVSMFGRFAEARSSAETRVESLTHLISNEVNTRSLTLGATFAVNPGVSNEVRANYSKNESSHLNKLDRFGGATPPPDSLLFPSPFASPRTSRFIFVEFDDGMRFTSGRSSDHVQRQFNFLDNLALLHGSHAVKLGVDYRRLTPTFGPQDYGQQIGFETMSDAVAGVAPLVPIFVFDKITFSFQNFSLYAQDSWRRTRRLTFSYGLRWELNPAPSAEEHQVLYTLVGFNNLSSARLAPAGTPPYRTTFRNFAPRVGLSYLLGQRSGRETLLRGGVGLFYDLGTGAIAEAAQSFPHFRRRTVSGLPFPLNDAAAPPALPSLDPPYVGQSFVVFDPDISLPRTYEWNLALEQSLGAFQTVSATYVGAAGRNLLRRASMTVNSVNFAGGSVIDLTDNTATSDYHALQVQFQRRLSHGAQALACYTWSHSMDIASDDVTNNIPAGSIPPELNRGASSFDVRHALRFAFIYETPQWEGRRFGAALRHWSFQSVVNARTAMPVDVTVARSIGLDNVAARPDVVAGVPLYLSDRNVAGGTRFNASAFVVPVEQRQGTLERNALRGFALSQWDVSIARMFFLTKSANLQFRTDAFNVLNHPNFADPSGNLSSGKLFGVSTAMANIPFNGTTNGLIPLYRVGGPRSLQVSLKFIF